MSAEDHFKHFFEIVNRRDLEALRSGLAEEAEFIFQKTQFRDRGDWIVDH